MSCFRTGDEIREWRDSTNKEDIIKRAMQRRLDFLEKDSTH